MGCYKTLKPVEIRKKYGFKNRNFFCLEKNIQELIMYHETFLKKIPKHMPMQ